MKNLSSHNRAPLVMPLYHGKNPVHFKGFSLIEMLMALLVASLLMAALAPVMTKKSADKLDITVSGRQNYMILNYGDTNCPAVDSTTLDNGNASCNGNFLVPDNATEITVTIIGAGGGGGAGNASGYQEFTSVGNSNFTVPFGSTNLNATLISGGGGGGAGGQVQTDVDWITGGQYSWTVPAVVKNRNVIVTGCGAGGGGGGTGLGVVGTGGGSGGYSRLASFITLNSIPVYIGGGGGGGNTHGYYSSIDTLPGNTYGGGGGGGGACDDSSPSCLTRYLGALGSTGGGNGGTGQNASRLPAETCANGGGGLAGGLAGNNTTGGIAGSGAGTGGNGGVTTYGGILLGSFIKAGGGGGSYGGGGGGGGHDAGGGGGGGATVFGVLADATASPLPTQNFALFPGGGGGGGGIRGSGICSGGGGGGGGRGGGNGGNGGCDTTAPTIGRAGNGGINAAANSGGVPTTIFTTSNCSGGNDQISGRPGALRVSYLNYGPGGSGGGGASIVPRQNVKILPKESLTLNLGRGALGGIPGQINAAGTIITPTQIDTFGFPSTLNRGATTLLVTNPLGFGWSPNSGSSRGVFASADGYWPGAVGWIHDGSTPTPGVRLTVAGFSNEPGHTANNTTTAGNIVWPNGSTGGDGGSITTPWFTCTPGSGGTSASLNGTNASGYGCGGGGGYGLGNGGNGAPGYARLEYNPTNIGSGGGGAAGYTVEKTKITVTPREVIPYLIGAGGVGGKISGTTPTPSRQGGTTSFSKNERLLQVGGGFGGANVSTTGSLPNVTVVNGVPGTKPTICTVAGAASPLCKLGNTLATQGSDTKGGNGAESTQGKGATGGTPSENLITARGINSFAALGAGGSGAATYINTNPTSTPTYPQGGQGGHGLIIVEWR